MTSSCSSKFLNVLRVTRPPTPNPHALGRHRILLDELAGELPHMVDQARQSLIGSVYTGQPCTIDGWGLAALAQLLADIPAAKAVLVPVKPDPRLAEWHEVAQLLAWHLDAICSHRGIEDVSLGDRGPIAQIVSRLLARVGVGKHSTEAVSRALRRAAANPPIPLVLPAIEPDK
jgi:hypothetical protein